MSKANFINRESEKAGAWSFKDFMYKLQDLSHFNIGGVPLYLLAGSSWFVPTNCELLSRWFAFAMPNANYVEGSTAHYRMLAEYEKQPYKWKGFHAWIEYFDEKSKEEKVLDPVSMLVFNKNYFYENENVIVNNIIPCSECQNLVQFKPTKSLEADEFDMVRLGFLMNTVGHFTSNDFGFLKEDIDKWAETVEKNNGLQEIKKQFFNEYLDKLKLNKHDLVFKLFDDKETFGGARFEEQNYMLSQMTGRLSGLQELGYITKDGEFLKVDEILEKEKNGE